jgi:hypothetical protein
MRRVWARELAGWSAAVAVAVIAAAQVAASARSELLFRDGDSLIVALFARSVLAGPGAEWALSSVLFLPESAVFTGLAATLPFDVNTLFAINAVINMLALYGAVRLVAGRRRGGGAPVAWSLLAVGVFAVYAMTETSSSRDAMELASLTLTTTYYSATVIGVVLAVGLVRHALDRGAAPATVLVLTLGAVATASTLTNPLFAVWGTVPLAVVLAVCAVLSQALRRRMLVLLSTLLLGTALGALGRIPFGEWIANTGAGYARPDRWTESLTAYLGLFAARLSSPLGVVAVVLGVALVVFAVVRTVRAADAGSGVVAATAWVAPVLVLVGAIALGTNAARYLQPLAFAPILSLVAAPRALRLPARTRQVSAAAAAVALLVGGALGIPRLAAAASAPDPDRTCVTDWVEASGRTGGGQFWTVRLPKLHLTDPSRLVQVDHVLDGYAWLVDRRDFAVGEVSFLVEDAQTVPWLLPDGATPDAVIECGRYRILDFGSAPLTIGPPHS